MVCGEVKCPFCIENCDFEQYVQKRSSCLKKGEDGNMFLNPEHAYYYQVQLQLFTVDRIYCDFVVCAFDHTSNGVKFFAQRILPNEAHWQRILPKLEQFWRIGILPEVLAKWYTRKHSWCDKTSTNSVEDSCSNCYCRKNADKSSVICSSPDCEIKSFHMKCLMLDSVPKTWYCPNCLTLPQFKKSHKKKEEQPINLSVMQFDTICICKAKPCTDEKLLECHGASCQSGKYFHLACLRYKKMPKNSQSTWKCPSCRKSH